MHKYLALQEIVKAVTIYPKACITHSFSAKKYFDWRPWYFTILCSDNILHLNAIAILPNQSD